MNWSAVPIKKKRIQNLNPWPAHWRIEREHVVRLANGKDLTLREGTIVGIKGESGGRFKFLYHVTNTITGKTWCEFIGGTRPGKPDAVMMFRSFRCDRVTREYPPIKQRPKRKRNA